mgnify:CR=1 FL=1
MIQSYSRLKVADNSGAKEVMCIRVVGKRNPQFAQLGDLIVGSVKVATPHSNVKKKDVIRAVVVRQRKPYRRPDGTVIRFDDNAIVLLDTEKNPRGSRIFGPVARELRERGYSKIVSMAMEVL